MVYGGVWWYMVVLVVYGVVWWYMVLVVLPSAVDLGRFIHRYLAPGRRALAGCYSRRPTSWPASTVRNAGEGSQVKILVKIQIQTQVQRTALAKYTYTNGIQVK